MATRLQGVSQGISSISPMAFWFRPADTQPTAPRVNGRNIAYDLKDRKHTQSGTVLLCLNFLAPARAELLCFCINLERRFRNWKNHQKIYKFGDQKESLVHFLTKGVRR